MNKSGITNVRIGKELREKAEHEAKVRAMYLSELVREAIQDHLHPERLPAREDLFKILTVLHQIHDSTSKVGVKFNDFMRSVNDTGVVDREWFEEEKGVQKTGP